MSHHFVVIIFMLNKLDDERVPFIGPNPDLLLSATCDEILSWMIEIWGENHLVSDNDCNVAYALRVFSCSLQFPQEGCSR